MSEPTCPPINTLFDIFVTNCPRDYEHCGECQLNPTNKQPEQPTVSQQEAPAFWDKRVEAEDVADFLERFYRRDRYHGRGAEYAQGLLASHEDHFERFGYDIISRHDSKTGEVVAYFGAKEINNEKR